MDSIDWSKVEIARVKDTRIFSGKLSQLDYAKMVVASSILNRSLSANAQSALTAYIRRNWGEHEQALIVEARQRGITPEQLVNEILNGE
jgi:hypothetical protein